MFDKAMPFPGGTDDQPAEWVEQIRCCKHADSEYDAKEQERQEREAKKQSGKVISAR